MLTQLVIHHYTIVDHLELELGPGMTVITGETGAGKSIMLDALGLTLGDRAESGLISAGAERAEIIASFDISQNQEAEAWLAERDLSGDEDTLILRRVLNRDGRSRAYINNSPVNLQDLTTIGDMLIDIHAQHDHQSLLKRESHRRLLDEFGGLQSQQQSITRMFHQFRRLQQRLSQLEAESEERRSQQQLLQYQLEELNELSPANGEYQALAEEQHRLANAEELLRLAQQTFDQLLDTEDSLTDQLRSMVNRLRGADDLQLEQLAAQLENSQIQLEETARDIRHQAGQYQMDPERLQMVESRLSKMFELGRKHRVEPEELGSLLEQLQTQFDSLAGSDQELEKLTEEREILLQQYQKAAGQLSKARSKAAQALQSAVNQQLSGLGMKDANLKVEVESNVDGTPGEYGIDRIEFLVSTNAGQPHRALAKVASGGELSRISLAIQVATADTSRTPTLVFDEVDVGIGGAVAEVVGSMLRSLGESGQILCVTHLPQVASQGHHHLQVSKAGKPSKAEMINLSSNERVEEIARMLGGVELTDQTKAHAEEMLALHQP